MPTVKVIVDSSDKPRPTTVRGFSINPFPQIQPARPKAEPAKPKKEDTK